MLPRTCMQKGAMAGRRPPAVAAGALASADVGTRVSDMVPRRARGRGRRSVQRRHGGGALTGLTVGQGSHEIHAHGTRGARCSHQKATGSRACWGRMRALRVESEQRCRSCSNRTGGATPAQSRQPPSSQYDCARAPPFTTAQLEKVRPPEALEEERGSWQSGGPVVCPGARVGAPPPCRWKETCLGASPSPALP